MPTDKDFKRLVRARMARTGEAYTTARAQLRPDDPDGGDDSPASRARCGAGTRTRPPSPACWPPSGSPTRRVVVP
jgi:hypothetical protein